MRRRRRVTAAGLIGLLACGGGDDAAGGNAGETATPAAAAESCDVLTAADVQAATGSAVQRIDRNPAIGAGGTCVNFAGADGQAYLGVNRLRTASEYQSSVNAVPQDVYPTREPVQGLGEEAMLFKAEGGLRYLVARQGEAGVVLFPLGAGLQMTDQQLRDLGGKALAGAAQ